MASNSTSVTTVTGGGQPGPDDLGARKVTLVFPRLGPFYAVAEPIAYAGLRALLGIVILTHGVPKLFRLSHGEATDAYTNLVRVLDGRMGLPAPEFFAMLVTTIETLGAVMLVVGLATRIVAPTLAVMMVVIAAGVHWPHWAWSERGMEYPVVLAGMAAAIALRGGGRYSLDSWLGREI